MDRGWGLSGLYIDLWSGRRRRTDVNTLSTTGRTGDLNWGWTLSWLDVDLRSGGLGSSDFNSLCATRGACDMNRGRGWCWSYMELRFRGVCRAHVDLRGGGCWAGDNHLLRGYILGFICRCWLVGGGGWCRAVVVVALTLRTKLTFKILKLKIKLK